MTMENILKKLNDIGLGTWIIGRALYSFVNTTAGYIFTAVGLILYAVYCIYMLIHWSENTTGTNVMSIVGLVLAAILFVGQCL